MNKGNNKKDTNIITSAFTDKDSTIKHLASAAPIVPVMYNTNEIITTRNVVSKFQKGRVTQASITHTILETRLSRMSR
ncbi:MAG: hypothetical protein A4E23_01283 [Methanomethylovorans sp. PtaU1.Bin073]|jgi:non-ribosomal peptide synthetase component F|nr:MAG: hypothetical protein A4E23_01283 [Methanomethylovorans sp. PtaU1.Bin073]